MGDQLLTRWQRAVDGEHGVGSEVTVPRVEAEESRGLRQELARLKKERTGHRNRLQGLLIGQGVRLESKPDFLAQGTGRQSAPAASRFRPHHEVDTARK